MCNRFTLTVPDADALLQMLELPADPAVQGSYVPRFNVAPTQEHWVLRATDPHRLVRLSWGMGARRLLNTRVETLARRGRETKVRACVIPADGFLEWEGPGDDRQPVHFTRKDGQLMLFAGLFDERGFSVVTTQAGGVVAPVHDRMPLVLPSASWRRWLDPEAELVAADVELVARRVSRRINKAANDDAQCLAPAEEPAPARQLKLF